MSTARKPRFRSTAPDKETLITAARAAIKTAGGRPIPMSKFFAATGMNQRDVYKHFDTWNDLLQAAGFHFKTYNEPVPDPLLLADWATLTRKLGHPPTPREYDRLGNYGRSTLLRRFGSWGRIRDAFRGFATRNPQWKDLLPLLGKPANPSRPRPSTYASATHTRRPWKSPRLPNGRPICGDLLQVGPMLHAPVNEMGVVALFVILAPVLGFQIEALQQSFPDCEAKRRIGPTTWQSVRIEFEYESRSFHTHGHPPEGCDVIVCWTHNWPDCPKNLEVIDLSQKVKRLTCK